jgi:hypothetical protein
MRNIPTDVTTTRDHRREDDMHMRAGLLLLVAGLLTGVAGGAWGQGGKPPGYVVLREKVAMEKDAAGQESEVWAVVVVEAKSGQRREVCRYSQDERCESSAPILSPQGDYLVYPSNEGAKGIGIQVTLDRPGRFGQFFAVSPSGDRLIYAGLNTTGLSTVTAEQVPPAQILTRGGRSVRMLQETTDIPQGRVWFADDSHYVAAREEPDPNNPMRRVAFIDFCQIQGDTIKVTERIQQPIGRPGMSIGATADGRLVSWHYADGRMPDGNVAVDSFSLLARDGNVTVRQCEPGTVIIGRGAGEYGFVSRTGEVLCRRDGRLYWFRVGDGSERAVGVYPPPPAHALLELLPDGGGSYWIEGWYAGGVAESLCYAPATGETSRKICELTNSNRLVGWIPSTSPLVKLAGFTP